MREIDPRMERVLTGQLKATFINAFLAIIVSFGSMLYFWEFNAENFILAAISSFVLNKLFNMITLAYFQHKNYHGHYAEMVSDAAYASSLIEKSVEEDMSEGPQLQQLSVTIMGTPEKTTGKYMGVDFYEWLAVKGDDGKPVKIVFAGTISLENGDIPPPGSIVLPPGLIYQVE
jgi:hypothetical protein